MGYVTLSGAYTTLSHVRIDGSNTLYGSHLAGVNCRPHVSQPLVIAGHDDILEYLDYFQSRTALRGNGIGVGFWGNADNTIIRYSRIHDVGQCEAYDHLIYLSHGNNVQIYGNWIWNDAHGRGVQLYPAPTNAQIFQNVIDNAGEGFAVGDEAGAIADGNQIFNNIIARSQGLPWEDIPGVSISESYGGTPGVANTFHDNVSFLNPGGIGTVTAIRTYNNVIADPHFANAARHDYLTKMQSAHPAPQHHPRKRRRRRHHKRR